MAVMRVVVLAVIAAAVAAALAAATPVVVPEQLLAYEAPDGIHIVAVDGSGDRLLRGTEPGDQNPEWSPHGDRVVLWTDADGARSEERRVGKECTCRSAGGA